MLRLRWSAAVVFTALAEPTLARGDDCSDRFVPDRPGAPNNHATARAAFSVLPNLQLDASFTVEATGHHHPVSSGPSFAWRL